MKLITSRERIMRTFIIVLAVAVLASCGVTRMKKEGEKLSLTTITVFKDVKDAEGEKDGENFKFRLGSSDVNLTDEQAAALVCALRPETCEE